MNQRQKTVIQNFVSVILLTTIIISGVGYWKNHVNRSESIRIMKLLSESVQQYRQQNGRALPPEFYINREREVLGDARLGKIQYRAQWIGFNADTDTILAYSYKDFGLTIGKGYVVMRLDGVVEWMAAAQFEQLFAEQRTQAESEWLKSTSSF
jgi:hypothetical protein